MAFEGGNTYDETFLAGADLSAAANQYKFVEVDSAGLVTVCNAATDIPIGVLQNRPALGAEATVRIDGISKVQADASLAIGVQVGTSADGQADAKVVGTDVTEYVRGIVINGAGTAGELVSVLLRGPHRAT